MAPQKPYINLSIQAIARTDSTSRMTIIWQINLSGCSRTWYHWNRSRLLWTQSISRLHSANEP